jgi:hypothetical protein
MSKKPFRVLSWGCGAPSTTTAVLSIEGHLPPLDLIIHADTQNERKKTVEARDWYIDFFRSKGIRIEIVTRGNILELGAKERIHIPFWTSDGGPLTRQCTREFKIRPVRRRVREILGYHPSLAPAPPAGTVEQWLGYTWEETGRQKASDVEFIVNRHPLIEMRWTLDHCIEYLKRLGLPVPVKSACLVCPFRTATELFEMKHYDSDDFATAVQFDEANRHNPLAERGAATADEIFIYRSRRMGQPVPLAEADLRADMLDEVSGNRQLALDFCEGPCGT